jgi:hypothetical protein
MEAVWKNLKMSYSMIDASLDELLDQGGTIDKKQGACAANDDGDGA